MSAPSLSQISGRTLRPTQPSSSSNKPTSTLGVPQNATPSRAPDDTLTESVYTEDSVPSSSREFTPVPRTNLKKCFPSLYTSMDALKRASDFNDLEGFRAIAAVFLTTYRTTLAELTKFPGIDSSEINWHLSRESTKSIGKLFSTQIKALDALAATEPSAMRNALQYGKMALTSLDHFFRLTAVTSLRKKALPSLPNGSVEATPTIESVRPTPAKASRATPTRTAFELNWPDSLDPLIAAGNCAKNTRTLSDSTRAASSRSKLPSNLSQWLASSSDPSAEGNDEATKTNKSGFAQRIKNTVTARKESSKNRSAAALAELASNTIPDYMIEKEQELEDRPYRPRASAIYFADDPLKPVEKKEERPASITFDESGSIKGCTLRALIHTITTSKGIANNELLNNVFCSFRLFSNPAEFFEQLVRRFDEETPLSFDETTRAILEGEYREIRLRVFKILLFWVEFHWQPASDSVVLVKIQNFYEDPEVYKLIPTPLMSSMRTQVRRLADGGLPDTAKVFAVAPATKSVRRLRSPRDFKIPEENSLNLTIQLLAYNSSSGRHEFARQLTATISDLFYRVNPGEMVKYWSLKEEEKRRLEDLPVKDTTLNSILAVRDFEEALSIWVSYSILKQYDRQGRIDLIKFWLDIAIHCLELRNFSSACCLFSGVAHSSVGNMKMTVLAVGRSTKAKFHRLDRFFSGHGNYKECRSAMDVPLEPTVPLTAPLKHDVGVSQEISGTLKSGDKEKGKKEDHAGLIDLNGYSIMSKAIKSLSYRVRYDIPKNSQFQKWLANHLRRFSNYSERHSLYTSLYTRCRKREPRNAELADISNPWDYIVENDDFSKPIRLDAPVVASAVIIGKAKSILPSLLSRDHKK